MGLARQVDRLEYALLPHAALIPAGFRLTTAADVGGVIDGQIAQVVASGADVLSKARAVAYLCAVRLKAIEAGDLAARLEALEAVLKARKNGGGD
jgi:hypothetical protein